ncbi:hypothetical protein EGYY_28430 [Eggerthella sp. YY7918]|nr:hypothetical protein EGYY_28430 [Eggerthella sp. YY7918]
MARGTTTYNNSVSDIQKSLEYCSEIMSANISIKRRGKILKQHCVIQVSERSVYLCRDHAFFGQIAFDNL